MNIVFIGSGNVATHLAKALYASGHTVMQVFSRQLTHAKELADQVAASAVSDLDLLTRQADLYIISVKDDALLTVAAAMPDVEGRVVHTAGSVAMDVLSRFKQHGVFYPFQTFTKQRATDFKQIPILVEASDMASVHSLLELAHSLSETVLEASSKQRGDLHIAAVFACNFVNQMYRVAEETLEASALPFDLLKPLIAETAQKIMALSPAQTQTGPAARNDQDVINKHLDALAHQPELQNLYRVLTDSISRRSK
ncbi:MULTISPECIES: Rossmann-like and DUF2520 domain-containing protein [unclassified Carboxylicivirga]|uniref:Rossmann-like and DUF2520 domain-containing protein n=1 Tax=Carboxylicivirga TaxID=1628153 RepID=UPI003D353A9C